MGTLIRNLRRALVAGALLLAFVLYSTPGSVSKEQIPGTAPLAEGSQWPPPPPPPPVPPPRPLAA